LSAESVQGWIAAVVGLLTALVAIFKYFNYRNRRDRRAAIGESFTHTVDALASGNETQQMAAAVLLRRFFDARTEQGGVGRPYYRETVEVIAGMLREAQSERLQKVLADGLRYARNLRRADLQKCDLHKAYLGTKVGDKLVLDLTGADLYRSDCSGASLRGVLAVTTVFYRANLEGTVFEGADLQGADFRMAQLKGSKFAGAKIGGARFAGAQNLPDEITQLLDESFAAVPAAVVPGAAISRPTRRERLRAAISPGR